MIRLPVVVMLWLAATFNVSAASVTAAPTAKTGTGTISVNARPADSAPVQAEDWQALRLAREAALRANPTLIAKTAALATHMRAFQKKLDEVILQDDPKLQPLIARLESSAPGRPVAPASAISAAPKAGNVETLR